MAGSLALRPPHGDPDALGVAFSDRIFPSDPRTPSVERWELPMQSTLTFIKTLTFDICLIQNICVNYFPNKLNIIGVIEYPYSILPFLTRGNPEFVVSYYCKFTF